MNTATATKAVTILGAMLAELEHTSSATDQRIRTALLAARRALQRDRDPLPAIDRTYERLGDFPRGWVVNPRNCGSEHPDPMSTRTAGGVDFPRVVR